MRAPDNGDRLDVLVLDFQAVTGFLVLSTGAGWMSSVLLCNDDPQTPASCIITDGGDPRGNFLGKLRVPVLAHAAFNPARPGWPIESGICINVTGTLTGAVVLEKRS